jgi:hypothetical protein
MCRSRRERFSLQCSQLLAYFTHPCLHAERFVNGERLLKQVLGLGGLASVPRKLACSELHLRF